MNHADVNHSYANNYSKKPNLNTNIKKDLNKNAA